MNLERADKLAAQAVNILQPYCDRIEIAGSIRRRRPVVNDIDLVVLAKDPDAVKQRCLVSCTPQTNGRENFACITKHGIRIDIFFAQYPKIDLFFKVPGTWGTILLFWTGSTEHNIYLVEHAKKLGLKWNPYAGVIDQDMNIIAAETEEEIFTALKLEFIEPERRER